MRADEARAQAVLQQAQLDHQRVTDLIATKVAAQSDFDKAVASLRVAEADLKRPQAVILEAHSQVFTAEKNLLYRGMIDDARGMVSSGGDGIAFFTLRDAQAVQFDLPGEAIRMKRSARVRRGAAQDVGRVQPLLLERGGGPPSAIPALGPAMVSAITVRLDAGVDPLAVAETISGWPDVSVHTQTGQHELLVYGMIDKARRQIGLFRVLLIIIMALILYTLTLDKIRDIALLKLMGARNSLIVGLILQQALLLGLIGYGSAYLLGQWVFPRFPRRVLIGAEDLRALALVVAVIAVLASLLGIGKARRVEPNKVLS